ncbi:MAG: hypothetical protein WAS54_05195 [Scrofimicrobium sp.]
MKYGHFDTARDEYVIDRPDVPVSWTNYLGTKNYGAVVSHNGGGYSYYKSPEYGRITRFRQNGIPLDRPGKYVYVRDDADGEFWSISWQPVGLPFKADQDDPDGKARTAADTGVYTSAQGLGYSRFEASYRGIDATQTVFIPLDDDLEVWDVTLTNTTDQRRELTTSSYTEFSFHTITIDNQNLQMSLYASGSTYQDGIIECDFYYEPWTFHYFTSSEEPSSYDTLRDRFIGPYRTESDPLAVARGEGRNSQGTTQNHCAALLHKITLEPGETKRLVYILGYGSRELVGREMQTKYSDMANVDAEFARLREYWQNKQSQLHIETPNEGMNTLINAWTLLQAETCVVWSRFASFVEVGGRNGLGYRDTAQDVMSVIHTNPTKTKQRIVELLRAQVSQGYGLHLFDPKAFDPDAEKLPDIPSPTIVPTPSTEDLIHGLEDTCSDDHLWLVPSVLEYVKETGDVDFLDEVIPFADGKPGAVYEHLKAALDFSAEQIGQNGVALGLRADWNDCLNLGGGETSLVTFLHAWAISEFLPMASSLGRIDDVAKYQAELSRIEKVSNEQLWDGRWWIRGYTRDGVKIGSNTNAEGKIFLEHQAWPVIAGIASQERGEKSMDSVRELLGSEYGSHLNWPAFRTVDDTVGFVTRVYPGIKENAAIFSHPNAWPIIAEAKLGRGDRAVDFYDSISPFKQNDNIEVRGAEPYAYVQFIYGRDHEDFGKAQNPWLTGTAGWMYTAVTKYILGVRPTMEGLVVDPSIPDDWDGFKVSRKWRGATYDIEVTNPVGISKGVAKLVVDGKEMDPSSPIPIAPSGTTVKVEATLG